jgi:hypothetical protein
MARRRAAAWFLAIPLMLVGSQVAHALAYRIVYPVAQLRAQELLATGHGYLAWTPRILAVALALVALMLANLVLDGRRGGRPRSVPAWAFASLPALAFSAQEFIERLLETHSLPWWMVEQPTFRVGLALQVPFGLVAFLVARVLLRTAHAVGRALGPRRAIPPGVRTAGRTRARRLLAPCTRTRGLGWSTRGPPPRSV